MHVTGYGVELAVKHTEYKAVDDVRVLGALRASRFLLTAVRQRRSTRLRRPKSRATTSMPDSSLHGASQVQNAQK